jgi:hypothetical protein
MLSGSSGIAIAQDEHPVLIDSDVEAVSPEIPADTAVQVSLTEEEMTTLLTNVDRFYIDQDMARVMVDVDVYRDPSNRLNNQNIRQGDPSEIAGLSTIVSHYVYEFPGFYELKIMGQVLAGSEVPPDQIFFSQMLPMPGAPIFTDDLRERFRITFEGMDEVDGRDVYKIRYSANDRDAEFFNYIVYFIDIEREVILRVDSSFDNGWYAGTGAGNFYYDDWMGKYLPIYGHGSVLFYPNRRYNVWGRWYRFNWLTEEELEAFRESAQPPDEQPENQ